jgi:EAL and modified HD-GYP domain-containing signal transduction protein
MDDIQIPPLTTKIQVGRQAIHDRRLNVYGYELLYRDPKEKLSVSNGDLASSRVLLNAFMEIGLPRIVGHHLAFINLTEAFFTEMPDIPFEQEKVVLEVLESITITDAVIQGIRKLHERGVRIALDDYCFEDRWHPLLPYCDIVKVEIPAVDLEQLPALLIPLRERGITLLAEKLETADEYHALHDMGFHLFQGYYFSRPSIISGRRLSENHFLVIRLLSALTDPESRIQDIEELIANDPALSLKVLRYINSAACSLPRTINSIQEAIILMGQERIRSLAILIALSRIENKPASLFHTASVRANMCSGIAHRIAPELRDSAFTVGLLSVLDVLMDQHMDTILAELALSPEINAALLEQRGILGRILALTLQHESHDTLDEQLLPFQEVQAIWLDSSEKAFALSSI